MSTPATENAGVVLVGGGPGAWDLITVRGMQALRDADVIIADHLGPTTELHELCDVSSKVLIDAAKLPYGRQMAQAKINELMVEHARAGKKVVRLKGGDPYVFGRGFEELQACREAGVPCAVVPGVSSAIAVPAAAGVPVTQRGVVHSFTVISGHLPPGHELSLNNWEALAATGGTLVVIMGVKNARHIAEALISAGKSAQTPATVIQEGTTDTQRSYRCTLGTLADVIDTEKIEPPAVYVIGEVADL